MSVLELLFYHAFLFYNFNTELSFLYHMPQQSDTFHPCKVLSHVFSSCFYAFTGLKSNIHFLHYLYIQPHKLLFTLSSYFIFISKINYPLHSCFFYKKTITLLFLTFPFNFRHLWTVLIISSALIMMVKNVILTVLLLLLLSDRSIINMKMLKVFTIYVEVAHEKYICPLLLFTR